MRPNTDFLCPFHGKYEYVVRLIASINRCTPNQNFNLYLVDDCSPNKTFLPSVIRKRTIGGQLDEQIGFGAALYQAYRETTSPWIVIMHSDIVMTDIYWLMNMQKTMGKLRKSGIKLVSARTDNIGTAVTYDEALLCEKPTEDVVAESPLPLFCSLVHRDLFKRIGGFIKPYPFCGYEEEELYWRMKHYGYKQAICGTAFVHHEGGATVNDLIAHDHKVAKIIEDNRDKCLADLNKIYPGIK